MLKGSAATLRQAQGDSLLHGDPSASSGWTAFGTATLRQAQGVTFRTGDPFAALMNLPHGDLSEA